MPNLYTKSLEATIARRLASRRSNLLLQVGPLPRSARALAAEPARTRLNPLAKACLDLRSPLEPAEIQSGARSFLSKCLTQFACFGTLKTPHITRNPPEPAVEPAKKCQRHAIFVRNRSLGTRRNPLRNPRFFGDAPRHLPISWCHTGTLLYYY